MKSAMRNAGGELCIKTGKEKCEGSRLHGAHRVSGTVVVIHSL
jgi:hypothetical protein